MSSNESEGNFVATSSITANFYRDDAKAVNAFVHMLYDAYEAAIGYFLDYIASFFIQKFSTDILNRHLGEWKKCR